ncbi:MAG TPA: hypothetical protein VHA09_01920, partial [Nitrososphaera sp.]|nr:hypothetical protein [Nitrososphaera sp.]
MAATVETVEMQTRVVRYYVLNREVWIATLSLFYFPNRRNGKNELLLLAKAFRILDLLLALEAACNPL